MLLLGLQKLTLLDFPGKVACTVFTGGCNFRCPFCHNAGLVISPDAENKIPEEEFFSFLKSRSGILDGVCITGGEPLVCDDIFGFSEKIKSLGYAVKLDTNGSFPEKLSALADLSLIDYVAMDIKNSKEKYALSAGIKNLDIKNIEKSVDFLLKNKLPYEFRTTVTKELHDEDDFKSIADFLQGAEKYYLQQYVPSSNMIGKPMSAYTKNELYAFAAILEKKIKFVGIRGI